MGKRPREEQDADADARRVRKQYTRAQLASIVQSSDAELDAGLRERNVITIDGTPRVLPSPLSPARARAPGFPPC